MKARWADFKVVLQGVVVGNLAGLAIFGVALLFSMYPKTPHAIRILGVPSLLLAPFVVGFVAAWYWRRITFGLRDALLHSLLCTCLAFGVAVLVFHEGMICLLILAPLFYIAVLTGALVGRIWFDRRGGRMNA